MSRLPIFIFDLDGTVSDDKWRHNLLPRKKNGDALIEVQSGDTSDPVKLDKSFDEYHLAMESDLPHWPGAVILRAAIAKGYTIEFSTARPERFRARAVGWLRSWFGVFNFYVNMREDGVIDSSPKLKARHIESILKRHGNGPAFFYDDRSDVCATAHSMGLTAYVVGPDGITAFDGMAVDAAGGLDEDMKEAHRKACTPEDSDAKKIVAGKMFIDSPRATVAALEVTETVGDISVKTRTEFATEQPPASLSFPCRIDPVVPDKTTAADVLQSMADTFRERNKVYGNNAEMVGKVMQVLFPKGVKLSTPEDYHMWHLFELKIVKLTRFAISGLTHQDSIHDDAVYSAMCELLVDKHAIDFGGK